MCDPTGISETAIAAGAMDAGIAGSGAAALAAATAAGPVLTAALPTAGGILGTGISGSTALGLGASAASTGLSMMSRLAQSSQNQGLYIQNALNQNRALAQTYNGLNLQQNTVVDKTATANFDVLRGLAQAKGKATAAAGEAGIGGNSFADVISDLETRDGLATGTNDLNYKTSVQQAQSTKEADYSSTVANITGQVLPSNTGLYLGLGADAFNGGLKIADLYSKGGGSLLPTGTTS